MGECRDGVNTAGIRSVLLRREEARQLQAEANPLRKERKGRT
jgi:hypothetical protein